MHHHDHPDMPPPHSPAHKRKKRRRGSRVKRFFKGYLMFVGALTTLYVLIQLLVLALVELGKWMPNQPMF